MKDLPDRQRRKGDDIDQIVDALISNPSRADDLKSLLRGKMHSPKTVKVAYAASGMAEDASAWEAEELWDNVPV